MAVLAVLAMGSPPQTAESALAAGFDALNADRYGEAARLFAAVPDRFPRAGPAADAYYWAAFASYRLGTEPGLREGHAQQGYCQQFFHVSFPFVFVRHRFGDVAPEFSAATPGSKALARAFSNACLTLFNCRSGA